MNGTILSDNKVDDQELFDVYYAVTTSALSKNTTNHGDNTRLFVGSPPPRSSNFLREILEIIEPVFEKTKTYDYDRERSVIPDVVQKQENDEFFVSIVKMCKHFLRAQIIKHKSLQMLATSEDKPAILKEQITETAKILMYFFEDVFQEVKRRIELGLVKNTQREYTLAFLCLVSVCYNALYILEHPDQADTNPLNRSINT